MKIKRLESLAKGSLNYDLNVEAMGGFKQGEVAIKAFITLFNSDGKIVKKATAMASNPDIYLAQKLAIEAALERVGV